MYLQEADNYAQQIADKAVEDQKNNSENVMTQEFGAPAATHFNTASETEYNVTAGVQGNQALQGATMDTRFADYLAWSNAQRLTLANLSSQMKALADQNDGQPLDWAASQHLQNDIGVLKNQALTVSMNAANKAAEERIYQRAQMQADLTAQEAAEARDAAERGVAARMRN